MSLRNECAWVKQVQQEGGMAVCMCPACAPQCYTESGLLRFPTRKSNAAVVSPTPPDDLTPHDDGWHDAAGRLNQ